MQNLTEIRFSCGLDQEMEMVWEDDIGEHFEGISRFGLMPALQ